MKTFFTSDLHLGHNNIIKYCNRPFKSLEHMNMELIRRWNERIKKEDFVYHIGDFCFRNTSNRGEGIKNKAQEWIDQLNGNKIFHKGNHDGNNSLKTKMHNCVINYGNIDYFLTHKPIHYNNKYPINLVGHVHEKWKIRKTEDNILLVNVGVDVWNFYPVTMEEILHRINQYNNQFKKFEI